MSTAAASVLLAVLKNGATSTLAIIAGIKERAAELQQGRCPTTCQLAMLGDQSLFVEGAVIGRGASRRCSPPC